MSQSGDSTQLGRRSRGLGNDVRDARDTRDDFRDGGQRSPSGRLRDGREARVTGQHDIVDEDDDYYDDPPRRTNTSVVRYPTGSQSTRLPIPRPPTTPVRRTTQGTGEFTGRLPQTRDLPGRSQRNTTGTYQPTPKRSTSATGRGPHWLLPLGVGMIAMLLLFVIGSLIVTWGGQLHDDLTYGTPRTYQTNYVVGHGGDSATHPSHFIAINYNRQAVVIEWMAGDPSKSVDYVVPYYIAGDNSDLTPVTVDFKDVNGDGKPDMVIHIHMRGQDQTYVFINDGTKFRAPNANDKIQL